MRAEIETNIRNEWGGGVPPSLSVTKMGGGDKMGAARGGVRMGAMGGARQEEGPDGEVSGIRPDGSRWPDLVPHPPFWY